MDGQKALYTGLDEYVDKGLRRWIAEVIDKDVVNVFPGTINTRFPKVANN